jgi:hypothetical protein
MIDTSNHPGDIVMIRSILGPVPNFHCFAPWRVVWETGALPELVTDAMFAASLTTSWGVLGLMSSDNGPWIWPAAHRQPFLHAALSFWGELDAVGPRYLWTYPPERLWRVAQGLHYVLANMGVPNDVLSAPLPPEGPRGLLRYAHAHAQA